jgi:hypothetical protein
VLLLLTAACQTGTEDQPRAVDLDAIPVLGAARLVDPVALPTGLSMDTLEFTATSSELGENTLELRTKPRAVGAAGLDGLTLTWNVARAGRFPDNVVTIGPSFVNTPKTAQVVGAEFGTKEGNPEGPRLLGVDHPTLTHSLSERLGREQVEQLVANTVFVERAVAVNALNGNAAVVDDSFELGGMKLVRSLNLGDSGLSFRSESNPVIVGQSVWLLRADVDVLAKRLFDFGDGRILVSHATTLVPLAPAATIRDALVGVSYSIVSKSDLVLKGVSEFLDFRQADGGRRRLTLVGYEWSDAD